MTSIDLTAYKNLYLETANQYIDKLLQDVDLLSQDTQNRDAIISIYIAAHSLKSQSLIMGYFLTGMHSGTLEQIFKQIKEGQRRVTSEDVEVIRESVLQLKESIDMIRTKNRENNLADYTKKLEDKFQVHFVRK